MADRKHSHPQAPMYGPKGGPGSTSLDDVQQYESALAIGWSQLTSVPTTISGYGITDAYTKTEVDALLDDKADVGDSYTKAEADALLTDKADVGDSYTKAEDDALFADKADVEDVVVIEVSRNTSDQTMTSGTGTNILFNNVIQDAGSDYTAATGLFVAPVAGTYLISASLAVIFTSGGLTCQAVLNKNGSPISLSAIPKYSDTVAFGPLLAVLTLAANDNVNIKINVPAGPVGPKFQNAAYNRMTINRLPGQG